MSVFLDTSAIYALLVSTEAEHHEVASHFEDILKGGRALTTTNYVLVEATALLQARFGLAAVHDLDDRIVPLTRVLWVSEELHRRAVNRLLKTDRRRLSLVDCASFEVMEREGLQVALSLDDDFAAEGFKLIPA